MIFDREPIPVAKKPTKEELLAKLDELKVGRRQALDKFVLSLKENDQDYFEDIAQSHAEMAGRSEPTIEDELSASLVLAVSYADIENLRREVTRCHSEIGEIEALLALRELYEPVANIKSALQELSLDDLEDGVVQVLYRGGASFAETELGHAAGDFPDLITGHAVIFNHPKGKILYGYFDDVHLAEAHKMLTDIIKSTIKDHPLNRE